MKKIIFPIFTFLFFACNNNVVEDKTDNLLKSAAEFYPKERAQVLVVGTFHFNYPGLDELKTEESDKIDVLLEPKKSEVTELVEYIKKFKPTKIAIEAHPGYGWNTKFKEYKSGMHRDERDERYQLAMRIANDFNIDTLYTVDANTLSNDIYTKDSILYKSLTDKINWDIEDPYWEIAEKYFDYEEKQVKKTHILDVFKNMIPSIGFGFSLNFYKLLNTLTGRTKMLKERVRLEANEVLMYKITTELSEEFFTTHPLAEDLRVEFFYFSSEDVGFETRCRGKSEIEVYKFLEEKYIEFKNNLNSKD